MWRSLHHGRLVTVGVLGPDIGAQVEARELLRSGSMPERVIL
jgi:hypothetical protein